LKFGLIFAIIAWDILHEHFLEQGVFDSSGGIKHREESFSLALYHLLIS
jgi:hypothetical protein